MIRRRLRRAVDNARREPYERYPLTVITFSNGREVSRRTLSNTHRKDR